MPRHQELVGLPYAREQVFGLVSDVERYPQFLPWCTGLRITKRSGNLIQADMMVAFRNFRESFTSRVRLDRPDRIMVTYIDGPFRFLENRWDFADAPDGGTTIDFLIEFEFRSRTLQKLIGTMFDEAVHRMVAAFVARADSLYRVEEPAG